MKGISPFISAVLLIAFTISVALIVISWGTKLFKEQTEIVGNKTSTELECRYGAISLQNLKFCSGLYGEISNKGNIKLSRLTLTINYDNNTITNYPLCFSSNKVVKCDNNEYNFSLDVNELYSFNFTFISSNIKFVYLSTSCSNVNDKINSDFIEYTC